MIAAGQWQPVILESELPGGKLPETARERELVARALRPPPPTCLQAGRAAGHAAVADAWLQHHASAAASANVRHSLRGLSG
jgi:hypothetical protein